MVSDAQSHAEDDKKRRDETEARNRADTQVYTTEKTLEENKDKLPAAEVEAAEKALEAAKKAVQEGGARESRPRPRSSRRRPTAWPRPSTARRPAADRARAGRSAAFGAEGGPKGGDGDVIDAEVVDKK